MLQGATSCQLIRGSHTQGQGSHTTHVKFIISSPTNNLFSGLSFISPLLSFLFTLLVSSPFFVFSSDLHPLLWFPLHAALFLLSTPHFFLYCLLSSLCFLASPLFASSLAPLLSLLVSFSLISYPLLSLILSSFLLFSFPFFSFPLFRPLLSSPFLFRLLSTSCLLLYPLLSSSCFLSFSFPLLSPLLSPHLFSLFLFSIFSSILLSPCFIFCLVSHHFLFCHPDTKAQRSVTVEHPQAQGSRLSTHTSPCWGTGRGRRRKLTMNKTNNNNEQSG